MAGLNDGKGNFTYSTLLSPATLSGAEIYDVTPVAADFNGDGRTDLLLPTYEGLDVSLTMETAPMARRWRSISAAARPVVWRVWMLRSMGTDMPISSSPTAAIGPAARAPYPQDSLFS